MRWVILAFVLAGAFMFVGGWWSKQSAASADELIAPAFIQAAGIGAFMIAAALGVVWSLWTGHGLHALLMGT